MSDTELLERYIVYLMQPNAVSSFEYGLFLGFNSVAALFLGYKMHRRLRNANYMRDTPTSKIRSAAQAYIELNGTIHGINDEHLISPLKNEVALWYNSEVYEWRNSGKNSEWVLIEEHLSDQNFLLRDDTGECVIDPDDAEVYAHIRYEWYGRNRHTSYTDGKSSSFLAAKYKFIEYLLLPKTQLFAIGMYRTVHHQELITQTEVKLDVALLLREWKSDYQNLLKKYDENGDGELDQQEWARVVAAAEAEIEKKYPPQESQEKGMNFLSAQGLPYGYNYLLSGISEHEAIKEKRWWGHLCLIGFVLFSMHCIWVIGNRLLN